MIKKLVILLVGSSLLLGSYSCSTRKQGCDCPTFGNHVTSKNGYVKTNASNHRNRK